MIERNSKAKDELLTIKDVRSIIKCSQSSIYRWMDRGEFPRPRKIGNCARWSQSEIHEFIENARLSKTESGPRPKGIVRGRPSHMPTPEAAEIIRKKREKPPYTPRKPKKPQ